MKHLILSVLFSALALTCQTEARLSAPPSNFSSVNADEYQVSFQATYRTPWTQLREAQQLNELQRMTFKNEYVLATLKFLYGPLTNREWGSPQRGFDAKIDWNKAYLDRGQVYLPYTYQATWIMHREFSKNTRFQMPVPYNVIDLQTKDWKGCTDSAPDHQTSSFYWYFWDPERRGCDHQVNREYQVAEVSLSNPTPNLQKSYPEYDRLFRKGPGGEKTLSITLAFGYVNEKRNPHPDSDSDAGAIQYQDFLAYIRSLRSLGFKESDILLKEYNSNYNQDHLTGHRFVTTFAGVRLQVNVVVAAEIDQMELFAKSFAQDHESVFGWFGHSRVGAGFDAEQIMYKLRTDPRRYSVSSDYQMIYWAGCNSYSYYTLPFFQMKVSKEDTLGTKNLDIISNGLPSYFSLNSDNAIILLNQVLNWQKRPSYQTLVQNLEAASARKGITRVLINVLGDEDNPTRP